MADENLELDLNTMRIGYARVSTPDQAESLETQRAALEAHGCTRIFTDIASGAKANRPGLAAARDYVRTGDELVVTRLDRLGRTTVDTLKTLRDLDTDKVRVIALDLNLDTGSPAGRLVVSVVAALAEWERDTLRARTQEGLAHARARGRVGGRKKAMTPMSVDAAIAAIQGGLPPTDVARMHGVSRSTLYRAMKERRLSSPQTTDQPPAKKAR